MRLKLFIIGILSVTFLAACSGESTIDDMYVHLEEAVELESDFVAQQEPLTELEEEEQALYQEISELSMEEFDQISSLADEALASIEERKEILETEASSIESAKEEFDKIEPMIEELEDESLQEKARELVDKMDERYEAYQTLHDAYATSLEYDEELYNMLKQEDVEEDAISDQIEKINAQYQLVIEANDTFNEKTEAFNQAKKTFYESTDLNVTYE
ncbi:hypothetical protein GCM10011351_02610 [Paraliobacillus quinghaiensis]|uniref:Cell-wall binding lipoprotein n=1 Tax=Paraliobacillus quinghaiensis TaxID=470815 RepID=A0A917WQ49_9BACI|nr:YkyA family protein [Paraliobacillus quinghaiensis]GGM20260.1 hypothetical protein GCM10011351_02610 [Paraliobacillus quinghaiensis]